MVAKVFSLMVTDFIDYPTEGYDLVGINKITQDIQDSINKLITKIRDRGYTMDNIELEQITNITQVATVLNRNTDKVNLYFSALNKAFSEHYMLDKEVLETMKIEVMNEDTTSMVVVYKDRIDLELNNGQVVSVKADEVKSAKGQDTQTITHA